MKPFVFLASQVLRSDRRKIAPCRSTGLLVAVVVALSAPMAAAPKKADAAPTRSTSIALTSDERFVVVVNREANSVSIIEVKDANGDDIIKKIAEIPVGEEPRCVAIHP